MSTSSICRTPGATSCKRAKLIQHHHITREELSVREHMSMVLKKLQGRRFVEFEDLFDPASGAAGAGGHLHRLAGAGQRDADRNHPGGGLCPDLCPAGVFTFLNLRDRPA